MTGVWTGAEDRSVRFSRTDLCQGANMALPIYGYFMNKVYADSTIAISRGDFPRPPGELGINLDCGKAPGDSDLFEDCLLYTSDAADERSSVDLGGRRIIKKKNPHNQRTSRQH